MLLLFSQQIGISDVSFTYSKNKHLYLYFHYQNASADKAAISLNFGNKLEANKLVKLRGGMVNIKLECNDFKPKLGDCVSFFEEADTGMLSVYSGPSSVTRPLYSIQHNEAIGHIACSRVNNVLAEGQYKTAVGFVAAGAIMVICFGIATATLSVALHKSQERNKETLESDITAKTGLILANSTTPSS